MAMAFGRDDTDKFYEKLLRPVLRTNDVVPVIINRRQSNDDLNEQIISQIESADFAVCDLTYARPSVYFEAGFAQRAAPVIYTVRADHLERGRADDLRVHFDLQMKPLITWRSPSDAQFCRMFQARLRATVLREWTRRNNASEALESERDTFRHQPLERRLVDVRAAAIAQLRAFGFKVWEPSDSKPFIAQQVKEGRVNFARSERSEGSETSLVLVSSFDTVTKDYLEYFAKISVYPHSKPSLLHTGLRRQVAIHHLVLVLRQVPEQRTDSAFRHFSRYQRTGSYFYVDEMAEHRWTTWWHFVSPVKSKSDATSAVRALWEACT